MRIQTCDHALCTFVFPPVEAFEFRWKPAPGYPETPEISSRSSRFTPAPADIARLLEVKAIGLDSCAQSCRFPFHIDIVP